MADKVQEFKTWALQQLETLVRNHKITQYEKIGILTEMSLKFMTANDPTKSIDEMRKKILALHQRAITQSNVELNAVTEWFEINSAKMSGGFITSIVMMLIAVGAILYYHIQYGIDYTLNASAIVGIFVWLLRTWKEQLIKKITYILQSQNISLSLLDRLVLRFYGYAELLSQLSTKRAEEKV